MLAWVSFERPNFWLRVWPFIQSSSKIVDLILCFCKSTQTKLCVLTGTLDEESIRVKAIQAIDETYDPTIPQCIDISPYLLYGNGWVPQHVVYASPSVYTYFCIYMCYIFLISVTGNTMVIMTFRKIKVKRQRNCLLVEDMDEQSVVVVLNR